MAKFQVGDIISSNEQVDYVLVSSIKKKTKHRPAQYEVITIQSEVPSFDSNDIIDVSWTDITYTKVA